MPSGIMVLSLAFHLRDRGSIPCRGIIVPTARQGRSQGENGNVDRFLMPRDSFTFRGRNEEGQLSNRAEHLSARAKRGKTAQRS